MKTILGVDYYEVKDVVKELVLSRHTIYFYIKIGKMKYKRKHGRSYLFTLENLQDYINGKR